MSDPIQATIEKLTNLIVNLNLLASGGIAEQWTEPKSFEAFKAVVRSSADGCYVCTADHISSATTEPGVGVDWEDYWFKFLFDGAAGETGCAANIPVGAFAVGDTGGKDIKALTQKVISDGLVGGFKHPPYDAGTITTGTFTPNPVNGNVQLVTNNGAHTLAVPADDTIMVIKYTNGSSAGAVNTSAYAKVNGSMTTTNGHKFELSARKIGGDAILNIAKYQ